MTSQNNPLVSIVTITRNLIQAGRADYFKQCLESIRIQDYPCLEHIIVDGASDDGTLDLFDSLGVEYVSEPDTGIYNAFNKGWRRARGKYIAFLNSDDFYLIPNAVSLAVDALEKSQADFSYAPVQIVDEDGKFLKQLAPAWYVCFRGMPVNHQNILMKRDTISEVGGFNESYRIAGDFDLVTRVLLAGKRPVGVTQPLAAFRLGGVSSHLRQKTQEECVKIIQTLYNISPKQAKRAAWETYLPEKVLRRLLAKTIDFPATRQVLKHNRGRFWTVIKHSIIKVRSRKGQRCLKLFGLTLYDEMK